MAYRNPAFFFYHATRRALGVVDLQDSGNATFALYDDRGGENFVFTTPIETGIHQIRLDLNQTLPNGTTAPPLDTLIIPAGHTLENGRINAWQSVNQSGTPADDVIDPDYVITESTFEPILVPFEEGGSPSPVTDPYFFFDVQQGTITNGTLIEMGELFVTQRREMSRGPDPRWQHPWQSAVTRFESLGAVRSTWQTGPLRKRYRLRFRNLEGADRQILTDLVNVVGGQSQPFWFLPPEDTYPLMLVELDQDAQFQQDFLTPLLNLSDDVTLPMIQVLG